MCVGDSCGDGLVMIVLCCCGGDRFEEDLCCGSTLGVFVDLVELDEVGVTLLQTVEALRGAFFFSTSMELNTKNAGGGGAGHEIMDSDTSLSSMLTPKHFLAVSAIFFDRSDLGST